MDVGGISDIKMQVAFAQNVGLQKRMAPELLKTPTSSKSTEVKGWSEIIEAAENNRTVQMEFDKDIGKVIIQVIDGQTQRIVAQIPSEELVNLMKRIGSYLKLTTEGRV
jgi:flagellar protein FlaG